MKILIIKIQLVLLIITGLIAYVNYLDAQENKKVVYFSKEPINVIIRDDKFKKCKEGDGVATQSHGVRVKYKCKNYTIFVEKKSQRVEVKVDTFK